MEKQIIETVKHLWETWDIRIFMLTSLFIQSLLAFLAPLRKSCASGLFGFLMWLLYLSADAVALFSIGLISSSEPDTPSRGGAGMNWELFVFWAPFLLLHLGGPDTITALSLEDNQLWHRHALQLVTQVIVTIYVFSVSVRRHNNGLWFPTVLIFVDGLIKYTERTCALYSASTEVIRDSLREPVPPNYEKMVDEYYSAENAHIPTIFKVKYGPSEGSSKSTPRRDLVENKDESGYNGEWNKVKDRDDMIEYAFYFYEKYKGLLADAFLSLKDDGEIREYFLSKPAEEAFRILEIELNLIYDVLHTKVYLTYKRRGCLRIVSTSSIIGALLFFILKDKSNYKGIDVGITFALLVGAIVLDVAAIVMLVRSDWWIIVVSQQGMPKLFKFICSQILRWSRWLRNPYRIRSSKSIAYYNLLRHCFRPPAAWFSFIFIKQIKDFFINGLYVKSLSRNEITLKFIINELQGKANLGTDKETIEEICSARGNLVLEDDYLLVSEYLLPWTVDIDYDESLLIWHLATDICYWSTCKNTRETIMHCKVCKELSDYMAYLLLRQQALLSQLVGKSDVRFEHTIVDLQEAVKSYTNKKETVENLSQEFSGHVVKSGIEEISALIAKAKDSQSVFHEACRLAKQLSMMGDMQWEIMSKVWVEMLSYAAIHSSARSHLAQLSKGGELITFVWLLMVHLGFREPLQPSRGLRSTKLIIHK
ncbi:hypothetical protein SOVF_209970 [Spinacia oleracea]|uniref:DUF4220 domain-containing protein n=1 Tax=Spinacia oleracea TaxID=3562 RepID=A0A9R0JDC9_SPIOL|nr:uncharacterized protein LOC110804649 [Spinacia oleracea]KNA03359.1 hypothetical protein SOVF_209970 [Spinacia oleracea]